MLTKTFDWKALVSMAKAYRSLFLFRFVYMLTHVEYFSEQLSLWWFVHFFGSWISMRFWFRIMVSQRCHFMIDLTQSVHYLNHTEWTKCSKLFDLIYLKANSNTKNCHKRNNTCGIHFRWNNEKSGSYIWWKQAKDSNSEDVFAVLQTESRFGTNWNTKC